MIKGFIEVHDIRDENRTVLVNIRHIVEVRGNVIYMDDTMPNANDYSYSDCEESYDEIKKKIKEAVGDEDA